MSESTTVRVQRAIDGLRAGDDKARDDLIASAQRRLDRLSRAMLRGDRLSRWEGESDVRQAAAVRLWKALRTVTPKTPADFFCLAAEQIRRALIDFSRHYFGPEGMGANHRSWPKHDSAGAAPTPPDPLAPEAEPVSLAEWAEFHEHVERLPADERAAYDLVYYQGMTHAEAAEALSISVWTLRRHYRYANDRLHAWLYGPPGREDRHR